MSILDASMKQYYCNPNKKQTTQDFLGILIVMRARIALVYQKKN